jgi:hypothetical protein
MKKLILLIPFLLLARTYNITIGGSLSSGKYCSSSETSTLYIPIIVSFQHKGLIYTITFPYEQIESKVKVTSSNNNNNNQQNNNQQLQMPLGFVNKTTTTKTKKVYKSGIADIFLKISKPLHPQPNLYTKVSFIIKFANARAGLGTGSTDFSIQYDAYKIKDPKTTIFGTAGYTASGEAKNVQYQDLVYASAGVIKQMQDFKVGFKFSHSGAKTKDGCAADSLSGFIIKKRGKYIHTYTASIGLSKGAADFSIGAFISFKFNSNY